MLLAAPAASADATLAPPQLVQSGHPDALKRRLEAERRCVPALDRLLSCIRAPLVLRHS